MHTAPMADSQGEFAEFKIQPDVPCRKCGTASAGLPGYAGDNNGEQK